MPSSASFATGPEVAGESGDFGGLGAFAVEFWFQTTATPASLDDIILGPNTQIGGSPEWAVRLNSSRQIQFLCVQSSGTSGSVTGSIGLALGAWYHIVCTLESSFLRVYVNSVADGTSSFAGLVVAAIAIPASAPKLNVRGVVATASNFILGELALYRAGLTSTRVSAHYTAGLSRGYNQELTSLRINNILDTVSSHAPRNILAGSRSIVPRYMIGQRAADAIGEAVSADAVDAAYFVARDGTCTYLGAGHRSSSPYNTSQMTAGDGGGAEIPYADIELDYSDSFLANEWNVTREGTEVSPGQVQTVSDTTSISQYGKVPQSLSGLPCVDDSAASTIATAMLAKYKDPFTRVKSVTFNCAIPAVAEAVFRRDLMDRITVKRRPPGGGSVISQDVFIQHISVDASPEPGWIVKWDVSPL